MRKLSQIVVRVNCRMPKPLADWLKAKSDKNGLTLSEQVRHLLIDQKTGEDFLKRAIKDA